MLALVLVVIGHQWVPQARWLMVHMVTLGLITTSIMIWGQHVAEALLKTRLAEETRGRQLARLRLLTVGVMLTIAGMLPEWPWLVVLGALAVSAALLWYAAALGAQIRAALAPRFAATVRTYVAAACLLPVGAVLGAVMAFSPGEPWQGRLLLAHQVVNVLGFVGLTVTGTLLTLWPTVLRTRLPADAAQRASGGLLGMLIAVLLAVAGALTGSTLIGCAALLGYLGSFAAVAITLVRVAVQSARQEHRVPPALFPILSIAAGMGWFVVATTGLLTMWWRSADAQMVSSLVAADVQQLTVPFVAGFLLQVLFGAMSHLLPVTLGGGPRATSAGLAVMSRGAVLRVVAYNLVVALFVLAEAGTAGSGALFSALTLGTAEVSGFGSLSRVILSLLGLAVLLAFVVLMVLAVRENRRHRGAVPVSLEPPTSQPPAPAVEQLVPRLERRALTGALLGLGSVLGATALGGSLDRAQGSLPSSAGAGAGTTTAVSPTGKTTTIAVSMAEMRFVPDLLEVPVGNTLVIELSNDDPHDVHDLVLATGASSGRLQPGASTVLDGGVVTHDLEGWCSIVGHRAMGMTLTVVATGASPGATEGDAAHGNDSGADELARVPADMTAAPGSGYTTRDARLPAPSGTPQRLTLQVTEVAAEIAPGVTLDAMTYDGTVVGPVLRSELGARLTVDLVNNGSMGHSLDLHAGRVAPDPVMRTIPPGERLEYSITTDHAGIWLYHCSTMPMSVHLAAGMIGALVVPPPELATADREYVLVQSEHYLVPAGAAGSDSAMHEGALPVSPAKIAAERPDLTVFNGHATQYVHAPLEARVGERVRLWVLAAGPSRGISFHVVGGVFDTVFKEGAYLLRPEDGSGGGAQALDLAAAQGGFVELVFDEPGTYTAVNHSFVEMERGARALIRVTA
ncbi:multicopper oxidase domain-containing protein [Brachybacterium sp. J153]|uniref:multicopper oxidase domain-containing protein n=1 Tax=Brachybacterium sp. J153 TaxID=3116488 RepID=UPI002E7A41A6|nr:multicopper oxidase domain-containing protein [Brachybacterium sp. J153]MEE1618976.1 multicopper oxidase domain-containing protein [Brachybacterium sp. J153]